MLRPFCESLEPRRLFQASPAPAAPPPVDRLPDLTPWLDRPRGYLYNWSIDRNEKPGRILLRLTTAIANVGPGPLEIVGGQPQSSHTQRVYQRIYNASGGHRDRLAGLFSYHPLHHHTHFNDFAIFRLRALTSSHGVGRIVNAGHKVSFCLLDSDLYNPRLPNASPTGAYFDCTPARQGISVGWADVYDQWLPDQWVDITGMRPGKYWLEVVIDPAHRIAETNEKNNARRILVDLAKALKSSPSNARSAPAPSLLNTAPSPAIPAAPLSSCAPSHASLFSSNHPAPSLRQPLDEIGN